MEILVQMSTKELSRLEVMQRLSTPALAGGAREKQMSQKEAGEILDLASGK